jgi:hypothetical protein
MAGMIKDRKARTNTSASARRRRNEDPVMPKPPLGDRNGRRLARQSGV